MKGVEQSECQKSLTGGRGFSLKMQSETVKPRYDAASAPPLKLTRHDFGDIQVSTSSLPTAFIPSEIIVRQNGQLDPTTVEFVSATFESGAH